MARHLASLILPLAILVTLWSAPHLAETIASPDRLVGGQFCGTGWKSARKAEQEQASIAILLLVPVAAGLCLNRQLVPLRIRLVGLSAFLVGVAHVAVAFFGTQIVHWF